METAKALAGIRNTIRRADEHFERCYVYHAGDEYDEGNFNWYTERAFLELLAVTESLGLEHFRADIYDCFTEAKKSGINKIKTGPDEPYSLWLSKARLFLSALETLAGIERLHEITKDIEAIIRASIYSITDRMLFAAPPRNESEVHFRIEGILRCIFPDLLTKPRLPKPIKSFEPDTGLPSVNTLIEYKFISAKAQVGQIADQVLADTRGYESPEWDKFLYVIYETSRIRSEHDWNALLRKCKVPRNTSVIVLSGEEPRPRTRVPRARKVVS